MKYYVLLFLSVLFTSCLGKDDDIQPKQAVDYTVENENEIQAYIKENSIKATRTNSGLYYTIDTEGTGDQPQENSNVTIVYKGIFLKGKAVFDQSSAAGATFNLRNLISGWKEGIPYFKAGGSGKLIVPAHLGYGSFTQNGIPGGSVLIFEIKLLSVN